MRSTEDLIASLSTGLSPVRRLKPPLVRALGLVLLATAVIAILVLLRGFRGDIDACLQDPAYLIQVAGAWLTGAAATLAAFEVSLPDRKRSWLLLPLPFAALWLSGFAMAASATGSRYPPARRSCMTASVASRPSSWRACRWGWSSG